MQIFGTFFCAIRYIRAIKVIEILLLCQTLLNFLKLVSY